MGGGRQLRRRRSPAATGHGRQPDRLGHGHYTRARPADPAFGTAPVEPAAAAKSLARSQEQLVERSRFGIPALVHEECLAGFAAWRATAYPVPLAWGATFNPELIARMANTIGRSMRAAGIHQGLAPVLDVARDYRWGRTEETISEDPYLVSTIGTAYVQGLEGAGIISTLKHFAGYSASRAGRNLAPVSMGPREFSDVLLPRSRPPSGWAEPGRSCIPTPRLTGCPLPPIKPC
ncbi:hypothetical protein OL239_17210 [Arthrobacter sp. ATA002]|nr:glycoside hydrolase family 3 N-terminal domain-containing protein [Arthrobacter sp. ATA002]WAP51519.1 hypothetical protein OL239_17210 [Arthrobacter sp. ATA002]